MRGFIVLCFAAVAVAVPQGYNYNPGQVSGPTAPAFGGNQQGFTGGVITSNNGVLSAPHQSYNPVPQLPQGLGHVQHHHQQEPPKEAIISKRFFIHSAPEEHEEDIQERTINVGTPKKNYNVVFIKAPAKSSHKAAIKIIPAVNEEKTVIYVLNKKSDSSDVQAEVLEVPTSTTKPEVFFIKYKTNEEAAHAQEQIQAQYDSLGGSTQVSNEGFAPVSSVIGALDVPMTQGISSGISTVASAVASSSQTNNGYLPPSVYRS